MHLTYTKSDATFEPPHFAGVAWTMGLSDDEDGPKNLASVSGSLFLLEDKDNKPFNFVLRTPLYNYHFNDVLLPNGGRAGSIKTFLVKEIVIEDCDDKRSED